MIDNRLKLYVPILFVMLTITTLFGQSRDVEFYKSIDAIKTVSELEGNQDKFKLSKEHEDFLNFVIVQTNWKVKRGKKDTYLLTLSTGGNIFYREFYQQHKNKDTQTWQSKKLHATIENQLLDDLNNIQKKEIGSNIDFEHLTRLPHRATFGYACYVSASMPEDGERMLELVKNNNSVELIEWLKSINPVKQSYAYLGLKLLQARNSISFADDVIKLMKEIETSSTSIYSCSGCTLWEYVQLKDHLTVENVNRFVEGYSKMK